MKKKSIAKKLIFFVMILIVLVGGLVFALNTVSTGFRTNKSTYMQVNAWSNCYQINNTGSVNDYFIPTATSTEWSAFRTNKPSDVSLTACSSMPHRIAVWEGKVTKYTDSNGVWTQDCSTGYSGPSYNLTTCQYFFPETIIASFYSYEWIFNFTETGCVNSYDSLKPTLRCTLCSEYTDESSCAGVTCFWHTPGEGCSINHCTSYGDSTSCTDVGCYWSGSGCYGADICDDMEYENECMLEEAYSEDPCYWDSYNNCCYNQGDTTCSAWDGLSIQCISYGCTFNHDDGTCHDFCVLL